MRGSSLALPALPGLPEVLPGMDLARLLCDAAAAAGLGFEDDDVLVVAQKIVSKAEGRFVDLHSLQASPRAQELARRVGKDPRFATFADQVANKKALQAIFKERFAGNTTAYWLARLEAQDLLCAPVRTIAEALADEQATINGMILEAAGEVETVRVIGSPIHMTDAPVAIRIPPPSHGRHTAEVKAALARDIAAE